MAIELLVRNKTNLQHSGLPRRFFWAQGEVVVIKQSPAVWGRYEDPDKPNPENRHNFWIITIEGIDITDPIVQQFLEDGEIDLGSVVPGTDLDGDSIAQRISKRKRWLDIAVLPNRLRTQLRNTGRMTFRPQDIVDLTGATRVRTSERADDNEVQP